ncbi:sensor histidine kinase [Lachnobacterium bovis]|uniref:histidine kinase n=1 Tax=Lachnobacterium bovis TaxID=140626 RepID=A0A1H9P4T2_9FIRM|nr:sensor histidine kinase [Lachnobacterium bovis]SER43256.1 Histidine kinase-, DNA gyrase B-, and HSP90-like ATPase [Lachnobacterium bovis]
MTLRKYLKSKSLIIFIKFISLASFVIFGLAYGARTDYIETLVIIFFFQEVIVLFLSYIKKKKYYTQINEVLSNLDEKYLVTEMIEDTDYLEGKMFNEWLYEIDKSMCDNVSAYERRVKEYKEFIEMWVHEVKIPVASIVIMCKNSKNKLKNIENCNEIEEISLENYKKISIQLKKIDTFLEQILYYTRSENTKSDYLFGKCNLKDIIKTVALNNKDDLLEKDIIFDVNVDNISVITDKKWLIFIVNQIVNNCIKYSDVKKKESYIKIVAKDEKDYVRLDIEDNGIGIDSKDLPKVFNKCFTGENGRVFNKSTGIGLYIVKKLMDALGHKIEIESKKHEFTRVRLVFGKNHIVNITDL